MESNKFNWCLGLLRLFMGLVFLWAFLDKLFGLGFATSPDKSWLLGNSPTSGFLEFGVHGPLAGFFNGLSGMAIVDWLFMLGLLFIGATLTLGILTRLGSLAGILLLALMYLAVGLPPENNPFIDEHLIYILVMILFLLSDSGKYFGFGNAWSRTSLAQKLKILK